MGEERGNGGRRPDVLMERQEAEEYGAEEELQRWCGCGWGLSAAL